MKYSVIRNVADVESLLRKETYMPEPYGILMVTPRYFDVVDVKNPYMLEHIGQVDEDQVRVQWELLYQTFKNLQTGGVIQDLKLLEGGVGLEDMVFCANPILTWRKTDGRPFVLLSRMRHDARQGEVSIYQKYFSERNLPLETVSEQYKLEGNGDLIPHPGKRLLWMGYGFRTDVGVADEVAQILEADIIPLKLVSEHFYHLDTCFCVIDAENVAICKEAFDEESLDKIKAVFTHVHPIPLDEAKNGFALNALVLRNPEGKKYGILQKDNYLMKELLQSLDVEVREVDTSEFIKSGGSVYCMKAFLF